MLEYVGYGVAFHLLAAHGREGSAGTCKQELEIIVDLGDRTYGRTRVTRTDFLLNGYGGRYTVNAVHVGFLHTPEELPRVGAEALHVAALTFGIERVERQRRFAAAAHARDHNHLVARDIHAHVLQVVRACTFYMDCVPFQFSPFYFQFSVFSLPCIFH